VNGRSLGGAKQAEFHHDPFAEQLFSVKMSVSDLGSRLGGEDLAAFDAPRSINGIRDAVQQVSVLQFSKRTEGFRSEQDESNTTQKDITPLYLRFLAALEVAFVPTPAVDFNFCRGRDVPGSDACRYAARHSDG
jgi:hypothetical protein